MAHPTYLVKSQVRTDIHPSQAPAAGKPQQGKISKGSAQPAPVIKPVGASSNYTAKDLTSVIPAPGQEQDSVAAAPSSSHASSKAHSIRSHHMDRAKQSQGTGAGGKQPAERNASQVDQPGLSGPQENALPGYQVSCAVLQAVPHRWSCCHMFDPCPCPSIGLRPVFHKTRCSQPCRKLSCCCSK